MLKVENRDIDWRASPPILTICAANAKTRKARKIPLVSPCVEAWLKTRRFIGGDERNPYGDDRGKTVKSFQDAWKSLKSLLDLTHTSVAGVHHGIDLRWHDLRHECGSRLAETGMDVRRIQELLGHQSLVTTQRYLNTDARVGEALKKAMG